METSLFKNYLISSGFSSLTVKNYLADVNRFIRYFVSSYSLDFDPQLVTAKMIKDYREVLHEDLGQRSVDRHLSSLRRYFQYLMAEGKIHKNPFSFENVVPVTTLESLAKLKSFKDYLYKSKASDLTIKNYIIDVRQFLFWLSLSLNQSGEEIELPASEVIKRLSPDALETYKQRLVSQSDLSVASINRKLSSLRTYLRWAQANGIIDSSLSEASMGVISFAAISNVKQVDPLSGLYDLNQIDEAEASEPQISNYSSFAPVRLAQKIGLGLTLGLDFLIVAPLADILSACQYTAWKASGEKLFVPKENPTDGVYLRPDSVARVQSLKRASFSSKLLSPMEMAFHRKFAYYLIHVRPLWYRKYKSYTLVRGLHTGVMMAAVAIVVMLIYNEFILPDGSGRILGERVENSGRTLSFKGALADEAGKPIKDSASLTFAIYTSPTGPQNKLWQEVRQITPDPTGEFIVALGESNKIPDYVFTQGKRLYVGVSVNNEAELQPRQPVPNVALAQDSQTVQGLLPITHPDAGSENVLLALDSSGNLTLGGNKSHTFQALGGSFQIKGQNIILSTIPGSSGTIVLAPDGAGFVDIQKPIQNTSEDVLGPGPTGSVLINDSLSVNSSINNAPALFVSHSGFGPLITASSSGQVRFNVDDIGSTTIGHNLTIGGTDIATTRSVFNLLNRNVAIINFAGESEAVTIGSSSGTTTIRNAKTSISGDLTIMGSTGISLFGDNSGINFAGPGNHVVTASSGNLVLGTSLSLAENANIVPSTTNGTNNLGSTSNPFDTVYSEKFVIPSKMSLSSSGYGFGTSLPGYQFHVSLGKSDDAIAMFENTDTSLNADVLKLKVASLAPTSDNKYINFLDGNNNSLGSIQASSSGGVSYLTTGSDFAEYFPKDNLHETLVAGDVVCLGTYGGVTKCDNYYNSIVGVITDRAGFVGASDKANNPQYVLVGLHGQVKVRVRANERILPGDSLTVSSHKGIARKSIGAGQVLGRAMTASEGQTMVMAYILPTWHDPGVAMTDTGNLTIVPIDSESEDSDSYLVIDSVTNKAVASIGVFSEALAGSLKTGAIKTQELVSGSILASTIQADKVVAPVVETEKIKVSILSPVTDDTLTVHLQKKRIDFISKNNGVVTSFDDKGNATLAGTLTASDASVSGTLRAKEIITENLNLSDEAFNKLVKKIGIEYADDLATMIASGHSDKAEEIVSPLLAGEDLADTPPLASSLLLPEVSTSASSSANFPLLSQANLDVDRLNVHTGLMVYGITSLAQVAVSDLLNVGNMAIQDSSINTLGTTLEIQPLRGGNISLMAGKVMVDTTGNAVFSENLTVQKTLFAKEIKPVEGNLNVRLEGDKKLNIGDEENSLTINSQGDVTSSGSGSFMDILAGGVKIVRGAQADTSPVETQSDSSAGVATITKGQIERTILSPFVTEDSLIYLTPASQTFGTSPYITRQSPQVAPSKKVPAGKNGSFTIRIQEKVDEDIKVNWWIIN